MTDKRISPLQWLSTKFASLNHSHSEYLTSHQDITGKEDKSNKSSSITTDTGSTSKYTTVKAVEDYAQPKGNYLTQHQSLKTINNETITGTGNITIDSGSDIDIVTSWEQTLSDEKVASEKLVKESIDSVLYETEDLELDTPTTSSNVTYTYTRPYAEQDTSFSISTLNTIDFPRPSNEFGFRDFDYVIDITLPTNENSIFIFGGLYGSALFFDQYMPYQGTLIYENKIVDVSECSPISGSTLKYQIVFRPIEAFNKYKVFFNDEDDTYKEFFIDDPIIQYSDNITISISAQRMNIPIKLSRYIDDSKKLIELPNGSDLNALNAEINYVGINNEDFIISNCPVSNKQFLVKNTPVGEFGSGDMYQQTLITLNDGANTEVWVRSYVMTGGYVGVWTKLETQNNIAKNYIPSKTIQNISSSFDNQETIVDEVIPYDATTCFTLIGWSTLSNSYVQIGSSNGIKVGLNSNYLRVILEFTGDTFDYYNWNLYNGIKIGFKFSFEQASDYSPNNPTYDIDFTMIVDDTEYNQRITSAYISASDMPQDLDKVYKVYQSGSNHITDLRFEIPKITSEIINGSNQLVTSDAIYDALQNIESGSGGNVTVDSSWVTNSTNPVESQLIKSALDGKSDTSHTHSQYLTEHQSLANYVQKETGKGLFSGSYADLSNKPSYTATVTSSTTGSYKIGSINISGSNVDIYGKDTDTAPPSASTTVPSADASTGSYGSGTTYARSNHVHPKSSIYAEAEHTHPSYVNPTIADNLTTNDSSQVLSAKQGKVLSDMIGQAISYINQ